MARQVALEDDVYEQLSKLRQAGESFSDVVRRIAAQERRRILREAAGSWKMTDDEAERIFGPILAWRKTPARGSDKR